MKKRFTLGIVRPSPHPGHATFHALVPVVVNPTPAEIDKLKQVSQRGAL